MKYLIDDDGLAINTAQITAVRFKPNKNDGSYKNNREYPFIADIFVLDREKPFTVFFTEAQERELSRFMKDKENSA